MRWNRLTGKNVYFSGRVQIAFRFIFQADSLRSLTMQRPGRPAVPDKALTDQAAECGLQPIFPILGRIRVGRRHVHAEETFPTACNLLHEGEQRLERLDLLMGYQNITQLQHSGPRGFRLIAEYVDAGVGKQPVVPGREEGLVCERGGIE